MTEPKKRDAPDVKAAVRALNLFEAFASEARALTLSELAQRIEIPVSSCHLLIGTLLRRGYLYEAAGRYYPTRRMLGHANRIAQHDPVIERLAPVLSALRDRTGESVVLAKRQDALVIFLAVFDSPHVLRPYVTPGNLHPLHSTSSGKALLGGLAERVRAGLLSEMEFGRFTQNTIQSRAQLEADLQKMSARGWYMNDGETWADVASISVAVPVQGESYAVTVLGPLYRLKPRLQEHVDALLAVKLQFGREPSAARAATRSTRRARDRRVRVGVPTPQAKRRASSRSNAG